MAQPKNIKDYGAKNGKTSTGPVWRKNTRPSQPVAWSAVNGDVIRGAIDAVTTAGGAIMFAVTSDSGAFSICVLHKDEKSREYPHTTEEAEAELRSIIDYFDDFLTSA